MGIYSMLPLATVDDATVIPQPGDGSCFFHSVAHALYLIGPPLWQGSAGELRRYLCDWMRLHPHARFGDTTLTRWIWYASLLSVEEYVTQMSGNKWGGGIEMAATMRSIGVNLHVYEENRRRGGQFERISAFEHHTEPEKKRTVRVVYSRGDHYDTLVVNQEELIVSSSGGSNSERYELGDYSDAGSSVYVYSPPRSSPSLSPMSSPRSSPDGGTPRSRSPPPARLRSPSTARDDEDDEGRFRQGEQGRAQRGDEDKEGRYPQRGPVGDTPRSRSPPPARLRSPSTAESPQVSSPPRQRRGPFISPTAQPRGPFTFFMRNK
jgi:hypothetical protein